MWCDMTMFRVNNSDSRLQLSGKHSIDNLSDRKGTPVTGHIVGVCYKRKTSDGTSGDSVGGYPPNIGIVWYCRERIIRIL